MVRALTSGIDPVRSLSARLRRDQVSECAQVLDRPGQLVASEAQLRHQVQVKALRSGIEAPKIGQAAKIQDLPAQSVEIKGFVRFGEGAQIRDLPAQLVGTENQSCDAAARVREDAVPGRDGLVGQPGVVLRPVGAVGCIVESDQRVPLLARVRDDRGFRGGGVSVGRLRARCAVGVYGADGVMVGRAGRKLAVRVGRASQVAVVQLLPAVDAVPRPEFVRDRTGDGIPAELDRAGRLGLGGQQRRGQGRMRTAWAWASQLQPRPVSKSAWAPIRQRWQRRRPTTRSLRRWRLRRGRC